MSYLLYLQKLLDALCLSTITIQPDPNLILRHKMCIHWLFSTQRSYKCYSPVLKRTEAELELIVYSRRNQVPRVEPTEVQKNQEAQPDSPPQVTKPEVTPPDSDILLHFEKR